MSTSLCNTSYRTPSAGEGLCSPWGPFRKNLLLVFREINRVVGCLTGRVVISSSWKRDGDSSVDGWKIQYSSLKRQNNVALLEWQYRNELLRGAEIIFYHTSKFVGQRARISQIFVWPSKDHYARLDVPTCDDSKFVALKPDVYFSSTNPVNFFHLVRHYL